MKGKIFLYCTQITAELQLGYKQLHYLLHLENIQCEQFFKKKKKKSRGRKQKTKEKDRMKEKKVRWK